MNIIEMVKAFLSGVAEGVMSGLFNDDVELKINASLSEHNVRSILDDPFDDPSRFY
jgi:hypothetical protein